MWWKVDFILQLVMNQLSSWTEKKLQSTFLSQTCTQKRSWSLFGGLQLVWKPLQLSESWENHYIWEVCSAHQWDILKTSTPASNSGQQKGPNSSPWWTPTACRTTSTSKSWTSWSLKFGLICHIHLSCCQLTTISRISTIFCRENASTARRRQKMLSKCLSNPKAWIFMLQE